jgi:hypothetical protein
MQQLLGVVGPGVYQARVRRPLALAVHRRSARAGTDGSHRQRVLEGFVQTPSASRAFPNFS